jgi:cytochrome P450
MRYKIKRPFRQPFPKNRLRMIERANLSTFMEVGSGARVCVGLNFVMLLAMVCIST